MANDTNIVQFPIHNPMHPPAKEEIDKSVNDLKVYHIESTLLPLVDMIINSLSIAGFNVELDDVDEDDIAYVSEDAENIKSFTLVVESLRAFACHKYGIVHPLHELAQKIVDKNTETGIYCIQRNLTLREANTASV